MGPYRSATPSEQTDREKIEQLQNEIVTLRAKLKQKPLVKDQIQEAKP